MADIKEIADYIETIAPTELRCEWDNDGLQVCLDDKTVVKKCIIALDVTENVINKAKKLNAQLIITHHPLIFNPLKNINNNNPNVKFPIELINNKISHISAHTRLDKVDGGVNDVLSEKLGLKNISKFGEDNIGRVGYIDTVKTESFVKIVKDVLKAKKINYVIGNETVSKVALLGGAGKDGVNDAYKILADAYITGDVTYSSFTEASHMNFTLIDAGHFYTEFPICYKLEQLIKNKYPEIETYVISDNVVKEI